LLKLEFNPPPKVAEDIVLCFGGGTLSELL